MLPVLFTPERMWVFFSFLDQMWDSRSFIQHVADVEALPHVYTSSTVSQNNILSDSGKKYLLPVDTARTMHEVRLLRSPSCSYCKSDRRITKRLWSPQQSRFLQEHLNVLSKSPNWMISAKPHSLWVWWLDIKVSCSQYGVRRDMSGWTESNRLSIQQRIDRTRICLSVVGDSP